MSNAFLEQIASCAREQHKNDENEKSFNLHLPIYNGLLKKEGNNYKKNTIPVTLQRNSEERDETDIYRTYFLAKDSKGRYRGYNSLAANRGNMIVVPTKDFYDCFGNLVTAWDPLQMDGNTLLVLISNIINGLITLPKDYSLSSFIPDKDERMPYEIVLIDSNDEYEAIYETIDHSTAGKSKSDNYTSVLGGYKLLDVTTGKSDLVKWTQSDMDRPLGLIDNNAVSKKVPEMAKTFKQYQEIIVNVDERTSSIVYNSGSWNAVFRALCLDMTSLSRKHANLWGQKYSDFLNLINKEVIEIGNQDVEDYWQHRLFPLKNVRNASKINCQLKDKDFSKYIRSNYADVFKMKLTAVDWFTWELFSIDSSESSAYYQVNDKVLYIKGGSDILGGKDRTLHMYKELNFLRMVFIYGMINGVDKAFNIQTLFEWVTDNLGINLDNFSTHSDFEKLGNVKKKGRPVAPRITLKKYIYG
jgi:hypothetical protein